jgi:hypothetical protein
MSDENVIIDPRLMAAAQMQQVALANARHIALMAMKGQGVSEEEANQLWATACLEEAFTIFEHEGMRLDGAQGRGVAEFKEWFRDLMFKWCLHVMKASGGGRK